MRVECADMLPENAPKRARSDGVTCNPKGLETLQRARRVCPLIDNKATLGNLMNDFQDVLIFLEIRIFFAMFPLLLRDQWENSVRFWWYQIKLLARQNVKVDKNFFTSDAAMRLRSGVLPQGVRITCQGRSDGAGMQALAYMSTISFAKAFGAVYVHSPFTIVDHAPAAMKDWAGAWEAQFNFGAGAQLLNESDVVIDYADYLSGRRQLCARSVLRFQQCWWLNRRYPDSLKAATPGFIDGFKRVEAEQEHKFVVAVHVRRGDVGANLNARRFTPNTRILSQIQRLQAVLDAFAFDYQIDVYSQGDAAAFADFVPLGCRLHLDADTLWTMRRLAEADVLLMSKSSFSYTAALVSDGVKIYEPTFNPPLSDWIVAGRNGGFDEARLTALVCERAFGRKGRLEPAQMQNEAFASAAA